MRILLITILALSMSITACSNKKTSSVATAPVTPSTPTTPTPTNPTPVVVIPGLPAPQYSQYYRGFAEISQQSTYINFLKSAFNQMYGSSGSYGSGSSYSFNYSCSLNIFALIFDGQGFDCGTSEQYYNAYIADLASYPAVVTFVFNSNGQVNGLWYVDAEPGYNGQIIHYSDHVIPFSGSVTKLPSGQYRITAGPLNFVTVDASNVNVFRAYLNNTAFTHPFQIY